MGAITAYSMSIAIILAIEYIVYKCLLANATFYRFNRVVLILCYAIALIAIPAGHLAADIFPSGITKPISAGGIAIGEPIAEITGANHGGSQGILKVIPVIYIAGLIIAALFTAYSYLKMYMIIRGAQKREIEGAVIAVANTKVSPFSWGRYVVVSPDDATNPLIIEHELKHVRNRHSLDLIFAQLFTVFNWFNPAAYLMRRELSAVHEYDVDREILNSGVKATDYQMLLIRKTVGPGFQSIANSLNHSQLKNRLTMMMKSKSMKCRHLCAAALLPAAMLATAMTDFGAVASTIKNVADVSYDKVSEISNPAQASDTERFTEANPVNGSEQTETVNVAEQMPRFPGGDAAFLRAIMEEMKYPEAAIKEDAQGSVVIRFVVTADGDMQDFSIIKSSDNADLDNEAMRTLRNIKVKWEPGKVDGKAVNVNYTIPVNFKLKKEEKK